MKKAPKPAPKPGIPGKVCRNCGQEYVQPDPGDTATYPGWKEYAEVPHENPFDCIRFLRSELEDTKSGLRDVKKEISEIEAPRRESF